MSLPVLLLSMNALLELLKTVRLLATSCHETNRQNSQVLMQSIFSQDITRLFRIVYVYIP